MAAPDAPHWTLVCGGFHPRGGMDRANAALAAYLADTGARVHLVGHSVDRAIASRAGVVSHLVPRPADSVLAGELALARRSARIADGIRRTGTRVIVVANGGNMLRGDVNWVHSVHHAWPCADAGAPAWFKVKNRAARWWCRRRERIAIRSARLVIANSERTRHDVVRRIGVAADRVKTVYIGADPSWRMPSRERRALARRAWGIAGSRPLVAFVGALGHDANKGIDTVLQAWARLHSRGPWDADLVVAGPGHTARWERAAAGRAVTFAGFTDRIGELLDAADLLVSPVRYEAYGLAMHEAICRGVPVLTSRDAGIVERFGGEVDDLLLQHPEDPGELVDRLLAWRAAPSAWTDRFSRIRERLTGFSLDDMAAAIVRESLSACEAQAQGG